MRILLAPFVFLNAIFYGLTSLVAFPLGKLMIGVGFDLADALMVVRQTRFYMTILCWVVVLAWMLGTGPFDRAPSKNFDKSVRTMAPKPVVSGGMDNVKCCATSNISFVCHDTNSISVGEVMVGSSSGTGLEKLAVAQKSGKTLSRMPVERFSLFGVVLNEEFTEQGSLEQKFGSVSSYRYIPTKKFLSYDQYRCMVKNGKVLGIVGYAMCKTPDDAKLLFEKTVSLISQKFGEEAVSLNERCGVFIIGDKHSLESVCVTIFKSETIYGGQAVGIMAGRIKDVRESRLEMSKIQDQELEAL